MTATARDLMQSHVISVSAETPLLAVQRLFVDEEIAGAPVTDDTGRVEGVISTSDLLRAAGSPTLGALQESLEERRVADAMTSGCVSVTPDASVAEVAATLRRHRIHRVLVVEDERLVGIISSFDLVALLEKPS